MQAMPGLSLLDKNAEETITINGDDIEILYRFSYLSDAFGYKRGLQEVLISKIRSASRKKN